MRFLTDLDPQLQIKGSRDPLGVQTIWVRLGRQVIGNLTTVSTSVRDFTTLLLGYYFAERVAREFGGDGDIAVFLRWEQLAAYARGEINSDWSFRGVLRVKKNLQDGARFRLGIDPSCQILSNQKTYGLWGLYTVPATASGLVEGDPKRLTVAGRELVEKVYLPVFTQCGFRNADEVTRRLAKAKTEIDGGKADRKLVQTIAKVLDRRISSRERECTEAIFSSVAHMTARSAVSRSLSARWSRRSTMSLGVYPPDVYGTSPRAAVLKEMLGVASPTS